MRVIFVGCSRWLLMRVFRVSNVIGDGGHFK